MSNEFNNYKPTNEGIKPSNKSQWTERAGRPIASRYMEKREILIFQKVLAKSYNCAVDDIKYTFEKILDENDEDRDDCLLLTYRMKTITIKDGVETDMQRIIFRAKVPVPEQIKKMAEEQSYRRFHRKLLTDAPQAPSEEPQVQPTQHAKIRPIVRRRQN